MVICKFFLQGTCKFGQNCKYEHQINDHTQPHSTSILRQQTTSNNIDTTTLVRSVQNDMLNAEKGGQWLLSSYAPFKDKPAFPGFEDKSFEEVRLGFYEASKSGTVEQFTRQLQMALKDSATKIKALQNPSNEAVSMLVQIYNAAVKNGNFGASQPVAFGANNSSSLFAQSAVNKNVFAQSSQQVSPFGQTQGAGSSVFGNANKNVFSNGSQQSVFGGSSQGSSSIFGQSQQAAAKNIFGGTPTSSNSVFGQLKSPTFAQSQGFSGQNSVFSSKPSNALGSTFVSQPSSTSTFGSQPNSTSTFGSQPSSTSTFGSQPNSTSTFGSQPSSTSTFGSQPNSTSTFGSQPSSTSTFGSQPNSTSTFGSQPSSTSTFGSQPSSTSTFGSQPNNSSPFGAQNNSPFGTSQPISNSPFASQTNNSPFGLQKQTNSPFGNSGFASQPAQTAPAFGQASNISVFPTQQPLPFGTQTTQNSGQFGGQQSHQFANSPFGVQQNQTSSSFGPKQTAVSSMPFGTQPQVASAPFGGPQKQESNAPFGTQQASVSPLLFGTQQATASSLQNQQKPDASIFAASQPFINNQQGSIFANANSNDGSSIFGQTSSIFGSAANTVQFTDTDESVYSKLEELSESDIKAFEGECFEFGKIPEKPPTIQMCF